MKIYQKETKVDTEEIDEKEINHAYPLRITYADILKNPAFNKIGLGISMMSEKGSISTAYWLIGKRYYREFLKDMNVKESEIEKLVGKKIIGFANKNEPDKLNGIKLKGSSGNE